MKVKLIHTGSLETEQQLAKLLALVDAADAPAPLSAWKNDEYWLEVMTTGRAGPGQRYEGSQAKDDTGGFFEVRGSEVFLTDKARECIVF
jgi:hypothetical protein